MERIPQAALGFLKPGDEFSLGGLSSHVDGVLEMYSEVLATIVEAGFVDVDVAAAYRHLEPANARAKEPFTPAAVDAMLERVRSRHARFRERAVALGEARSREVTVTREPDSPYVASADLVARWLAEHYDEHVPHVAELVAEWEATA